MNWDIDKLILHCFNYLLSFIFHTQNTVLTFSLLNYNNILRIEKTRPGTADILVTDRYECVCVTSVTETHNPVCHTHLCYQ